MSKRFVAKRVLVTGAASGIGRATAARMAAEGAALVLGDIDPAGLRDISERILLEHQTRPRTVVYDAADPASCRRLVEAAEGELDVVCNIAGNYDRARFTDTADAQWDRVLAVNLDSVFHISKAALPLLVRRRGNIVNTASIAGITGLAYACAYAVAKAGIIALTKSLAAEYGEAGVRVNVVCPGGVKTAIGRDLQPIDGANAALLARLTPKLGTPPEKGEPEDIAAAFAYLASDEARYVSGTALVIDGAQMVG